MFNIQNVNEKEKKKKCHIFVEMQPLHKGFNGFHKYSLLSLLDSKQINRSFDPEYLP